VTPSGIADPASVGAVLATLEAGGCEELDDELQLAASVAMHTTALVPTRTRND